MKRIGIISDTHAYWDERYAHHFAVCDEVWHAGDFGSMDIVDHLRALRTPTGQPMTVRGVWGNIDGQDIRREFPEIARFTVEEVDVMMKHIGGYPGRYDRSIYARLMLNPPMLFVSGHSHIMKVMMDRRLHCLHINPGAAGLYGQQPVRTVVRLTIDGRQMKDREVIEMN